MEKLLIAFVALEHIGFLILEMFLWNKPIGQKIFRLTPEFAAESASLAANQGLYNGFLAAGLMWSLFHSNIQTAFQLQVFFLTCIIIAAIFGAATVKVSILYMQGLPALICLIVILLKSRGN